MADNKLNIEIKVDRKELQTAKNELKKFTDELKLYSKAELETIRANAKIQVAEERTKVEKIKGLNQQAVIDKKTQSAKEVIDYKQVADQKSKAEKQLLAELNSYSKKQTQAERDALQQRANNWKKTSEQINAQLAKDAQLIRQTEQRRLESVFRPIDKGNPNLKGQSVNLNSLEALQQQKKYYTDLFKTLEQGTPHFTNTQNKLRGLNEELRNFGTRAKQSKFQLLEYYENLTTVAGGLTIFGVSLVAFTQKAITSAAELEVYSKKFVELAGSENEARIQLENLRTASAGNLNDIELVKYSNKMRLLGFTVEDTTKLLDIVERKADEVGVSFSEGESALQSFILTGRGRALKELGINLDEVTAEMDSLILASGKSKDAMESEELEAIRLQAILNKYGDTLENINIKQKDSGDRIKSISTGFENLSTLIGNSLLPSFNKLYNQISDFNNIVKDASGNSGILEQTLKEIVSINFSMITGVFSYWNELILDLSVNTYGWLVHLINAGSELDKIINGAPQQGLPKEGVNSDGTSNIDRPFNPRYDKNTQKIAKRGIGEEQILDKVSGSKGSGTAKDIPVITNEIDDLTKSIADLQAKLGITNPTSTLFFIYSQQITELQNKIDYLNSSFKDSTGLDFITNLPKYDNSQNIKGQELSVAEQVNLTGIDKQAMQKEAYDKIVNGSQQALSNVENIFQILDIGTETFVGKLVSGFQSAISLVGSIVNILSNLSGGGGGGIFGSLLGLVGLIPGVGTGVSIGASVIGGVLGGGGRNIGNLASGSGGGQSPIVNKIYINSSIDTQKFFSDGVTTFYKNRKLNTAG